MMNPASAQAQTRIAVSANPALEATMGRFGAAMEKAEHLVWQYEMSHLHDEIDNLGLGPLHYIPGPVGRASQLADLIYDCATGGECNFDPLSLGPPVPSLAPGGYGKGNGGGGPEDAGSGRPPNLTPEGAGRRGALNEAKRNNGIPTSQQPVRVTPNLDRRGNQQPGRVYEYEVPTRGGGKEIVKIRDDASGHFFGPGDPQNRGPHFNDSQGRHYDY
jgi:hypothetical protein